MQTMSQVELKRVYKAYGTTVALHEVDLRIEEGEFLTLLGPSGCGKTTTLRLIAGFIEPTRGTILLGNKDVTRLPPHRREIGMVFQDYALFPHMTVRDNIGFGLKERGAGRSEIERRAAELLELIRLPHIALRYPSELSGGQAQRVSFARAIAHPPKVLLMDEPLGALDLKLRETMQLELRRLQQALKITTVFVTHDQGEAMSMSDRIAVMNQGRIEQIGTAEDIYREPCNRFVAGFVGQINLIEGKVSATDAGYASLVTKQSQLIHVQDPNHTPAGSLRAVAIRPEKMRLHNGTAPHDAVNTLEGRVVARSFAGNSVKLVVDVGEERPLVIEDRPSALEAAVGEKVRVGWSADDGRLLDN